MVGSVAEWMAQQSLIGVAMIVLASMALAAFVGHVLRQVRRRLSPAREEAEHNQENSLVGDYAGPAGLAPGLQLQHRGRSFRRTARHWSSRKQTLSGRPICGRRCWMNRIAAGLVGCSPNIPTIASPWGPLNQQVPKQLAVNDKLLTEIWAGVTATGTRRMLTALRCRSSPRLTKSSISIRNGRSPGRPAFRNRY